MRRKLTIILTALATVGVLTYLFEIRPNRAPGSIFEPTSTQGELANVIKKDTSLYENLSGRGLTYHEIIKIVDAAKPYKNLRSIQPGTRYELMTHKGPVGGLSGVKFQFSPIEYLELRMKDDESGWIAKEIKEKVDIKEISFQGVVTSSLWQSALDAKMDPSLIADLSEVFAWQVDFAREVRKLDRWRLTVEQRWAKGQQIGWGQITAAEYINDGRVYRAVYFKPESKSAGYFAPDGSSMKRMFLKSPIRFGRISSRFTMRRFHPILKRNRPHLGVDYAAPRGTPIRAVGDGTIVFAARKGGGGKTIKIRHNSTYQTAYKHLSGYAPGIRRGKRVSQGQTIGYVGSTGLSTGPHLHFEFYENGRFVDPLGRKFPKGEPVPKTALEDFKALAEVRLEGLPQWDQNKLDRPTQDEDVAELEFQPISP